MDYTSLLKELNQANLFDLYRLHVAIGNQLDSPDRILAVKNQLQLGMEISYFHANENRLIKGKLIEIKPKKAVVLDYEKNKEFVVPYYMLNVEGVDVEIYKSKKEALTINNLKVGDRVGFNKDGQSVVGVIKRLSQKSVTLVTNIGAQWRVAYAYLYRIHDAESAIEGVAIEVIK